jgi:hypothetical protein
VQKRPGLGEIRGIVCALLLIEALVPPALYLIHPRSGIGKRPLDESCMLAIPHFLMHAPFPFNSLSPKQTVIVSELLREHPQGVLENENGKPVFVSAPGASGIRIPLSEPRRQAADDRQAGGQVHSY